MELVHKHPRRKHLADWVYNSTINDLAISNDCNLLLVPPLALREAWKQRGLVEFAYFAGSLFYTLGSYLGFFQVINLGRDRIRLVACSGTSREAYWGSLLYLVGALFFNVGCVEGLLPAAVRIRYGLFWGLYYTPHRWTNCLP